MAKQQDPVRTTAANILSISLQNGDTICEETVIVEWEKDPMYEATLTLTSNSIHNPQIHPPIYLIPFGVSFGVSEFVVKHKCCEEENGVEITAVLTELVSQSVAMETRTINVLCPPCNPCANQDQSLNTTVNSHKASLHRASELLKLLGKPVKLKVDASEEIKPLTCALPREWIDPSQDAIRDGYSVAVKLVDSSINPKPAAITYSVETVRGNRKECYWIADFKTKADDVSGDLVLSITFSDGTRSLTRMLPAILSR